MPEWVMRAFPVMMIAESLAAGIVYACSGEWIHAGYWLTAAVLTTFVTMMKG